jgi:hypothetical protein
MAGEPDDRWLGLSPLEGGRRVDGRKVRTPLREWSRQAKARLLLERRMILRLL